MRFVLCVVVFLLCASRGAAQEIAPSQAALRLVDAVQASLAQNPLVRIQQLQVDVNRGLREQAAAPFNDLFGAGFDRARAYTPFASTSGISLQPNSTSQANAFYSRLLRNGVTVNGGVNLQRTLQNDVRPDGLTTSRTNLGVLFPLMRGKGREITTAGERSAGLTVDSSELDLRHVTASQLLRVGASYWGLVAATRTLAVEVASAARGDLLVENMRTMIAADQTPRGDLASTLANLADRQSSRIAAEQAVIDAREQLIVDTGIRPDAFPTGAALDDFPAVTALPALETDPTLVQRFVDAALERRADYLAAKMRLEASKVTADASKNGLLPELNLGVDVGYAALAGGNAFDRYLAGLGSGVRGMDVVGRVSYEFPTSNSLALGRFASADAQRRQAEVRVADLARSINASVIAAYSGLRNAVLRLQKARESVDAFQAALQGERDKLALGIGSVVSLLTIEDRLTTASERDVAAWYNYAQALLQFRFATGSLIPAHDALPVLDDSTFTTFPPSLLAPERR
jgi:outer membrane protein TolC